MLEIHWPIFDSIYVACYQMSLLIRWRGVSWNNASQWDVQCAVTFKSTNNVSCRIPFQPSESDDTQHVFCLRHFPANLHVTSMTHFATMTTAAYITAAPAGPRVMVRAQRRRCTFSDPGKWSSLLNDSICISLFVYIICETKCLVTLWIKTQLWHHWLRLFGQTVFSSFQKVSSFLL
jgi:hypothetical protein